MTSLLLDFQRALMLAFPLIWVGALVTMVGYAAKKKPAGEKPKPPRWLFVAVGSYIGLNLLTFFAVSALAHAHFDETLADPGGFVLEAQGKKVELAEATEVAELSRLLRSGEGVAAHHSHPLEPVVIAVPRAGDVYALGPDSANADEYWLKLTRSTEFGDREQQVRQFRSPELTAFLRSRGLR